jgi:hypothetical protein
MDLKKNIFKLMSRISGGGREAGSVWWGGRGPLGVAFLQLLISISTLTWRMLQFSSLKQIEASNIGK